MTFIVRLVSTLLVLASFVVAQASIQQVKVQFAKGTSSTTIKSSIKGDKTIDYVVRAAAGQNMKVTLKTSNGSNYFNVIPPGESEVSIFTGSNDGNAYEGKLPSSGDYKIRVYLMRNAARRNETASYSLTISVTGKAQGASGAVQHAASGNDKVGEAIERASQGKFNATGKVPCAQTLGQPMAQCDMGVARAGNGSAAVAVTMPGGHKRMIFFTDGKATGSDWSQADGGDGTFKVTKQSDLYMISIGNERYEIPEAVVYGG